MKRIVLSVFALIAFGFGVQAQTTSKIVLTKGQKIKMNTTMKSDLVRGEQGAMKSDLTIVTKMMVTNVTETSYEVEATMMSAKMDFEGFGMNMEYDSEDPEKNTGQMAKGFEKVLGKTEKLNVGFDGKVTATEEKEDKGMMKMMMGGADAASAVEGAFLIIPEGTNVDDKWRTTKEEDGLKVITEYKYLGTTKGQAALTANQQTKGEVAGGRGGMFTQKVNQLTQMKILVDAETGLVTMKDITTKDKSSTVMGEKTYNTTGVIKTKVTCE